MEAAGLPEQQVFDGSRLREPEIVERVRALDPEVGLSVQFGYILEPSFFEIFPRGCLNLHSSLLPYNRGAHPNVWSIVEGTPAGVTLHAIDSGVDAGPILAQREVEVEPVDTGKTLYHKLERAALELFVEAWPSFKEGRLVPRDQAVQEGSAHRVRDLESLGEIDLDRASTPREVLNLLRARTFPPYPGAYFVQDGRKVHVRIELEYGDEVES
jgi:methionyl-tRNA formyltransferase